MRLRKIILSIIAGVMIVCFTAPAQLRAQEYSGKPGSVGYTGSSASAGEQVYKKPYKYGSHKRYGRYEGRRYEKRYNKYQRRILKKIRKNERRIRKYERKIRKYRLRRYYRHYRHYRHGYYSRRIGYYIMKIHQLERRNRYLRRLLYR